MVKPATRRALEQTLRFPEYMEGEVGMKCVYCNENNDFNGEHVFPAALGGDDKRYMLEDCVCAGCNSSFSIMELELARRSPISLGRLGNQPKSRDRGGKDNPTKMETRSSYMLDPEHGQMLDVVVGPRFESEILPQVIIKDNNALFHGVNLKKVKDFVSKAEILIKSEVLVAVIKNGPQSYIVRSYKQSEGKYSFFNERIESRAPKLNALWLIEAHEPNIASDEKGFVLHPRFFLHAGKSINYKALSLDGICHDLQLLHSLINNFDASSPVDGQIEKPQVKMSMSFNYESMLRVMAKIGMNLLIYKTGADYARDAAFTKTKNYICKGEPWIGMQLPGEGDPLDLLMGDPAENAHTMILLSVKQDDNTFWVCFMIRFYGGQPFFMVLADNAPDPSFPELPMIFHVHYNMNVITEIDPIIYYRKKLNLGFMR